MGDSGKPLGEKESCGSCGQGNGGSKAVHKNPKDQKYEDERKAIAKNMAPIRHKILVLSGKGGVGKSTVAVNLAAALAKAGERVGLMDIDIHGPSIVKLVKVDTLPAQGKNKKLKPALSPDGIEVMSIGYFLDNKEDAVIWRGPMKHGVIRQFLMDVDWGELDYLIVDSPPGTGDEPLSITQSIENADGAVIVTTPQEVAVDDVRRSIAFCRQLNLPVLGVVENMSGFVCPHCAKEVDIFKQGGGEAMAREMKVNFLGRIPIDPAMVTACDNGVPYMGREQESNTTRAFNQVIDRLLQVSKKSGTSNASKTSIESNTSSVKSDTKMNVDRKNIMKIAIPMVQGRLSPHFGHCECFVLFDVDEGKKEILNRTEVDAPPHEPGLLPGWLHQKGVEMIFAGGMGQRAQDLFTQSGVKVLVGSPSDEPEAVVRAWFNGTLSLGQNVCDH